MHIGSKRFHPVPLKFVEGLLKRVSSVGKKQFGKLTKLLSFGLFHEFLKLFLEFLQDSITPAPHISPCSEHAFFSQSGKYLFIGHLDAVLFKLNKSDSISTGPL